jgi:hypothetical protein
MSKALEGELPNYITNNIISYINIEPNYMIRNPRFFTPSQCRTKSYKDSFFQLRIKMLYSVFDKQWTNIKIMDIIFNCIPTGTLGAVGQMRLKQVVI